jgi:hypothetical protein
MKKRYPTIAAAVLAVGVGCYSLNFNPWHPTKAALTKVFVPPQFRSESPVVAPDVKPVVKSVPVELPKVVIIKPTEEPREFVTPVPPGFETQLHAPKKETKKALKAAKKKVSKVSKGVVKKCIVKDGKLKLLR